MTLSPAVKYALRILALLYVAVLLIVPLGLILWRAFAPGLVQFWEYISTPAAISAFNLSLLVVAIVVPLNVIFGCRRRWCWPATSSVARAFFRPSSTCHSRCRRSS